MRIPARLKNQTEKRALIRTLLYHKASDEVVSGGKQPLSSLAGSYGMNFEKLPELHSRSGSFILPGLMFTIVAVLLTVLRRKKWL